MINHICIHNNCNYMAQIEVRSKTTGKTRFISERNLEANRDKFELVTDSKFDVVELKYTPESETIKKKVARVAGVNKTKQTDGDISKGPE